VGERLAAALAARQQPLQRPLVLLLEANLGKVLGGYATRWGTLDVPLVVVDEVPPRDAQFVRLGRPVEGTVPLSLYGIR
jgi:ethanolamine utilization protein EutA